MADTEPQWTAGQVKEFVDDQIEEVRRAVDVARAGQPPHVTLQYHIEALMEAQKESLALALTSADKLEQERLARNSDQIECERRITELTRELSNTAILKAEVASEKQFGEFKTSVLEQVSTLQALVTSLSQRLDRMV